MPKIALKNDGERMIPAYHKDKIVYSEHITRYEAALPFCKNKIVLDIASGSGYGSNLISQASKKVYGVDVDEGAVRYAQENYGSKNIEFKLGSATDIPLPNNSVDVVITLETIEHVADYKRFMREIKRVLRPDGIAIISTPNDKEFAEGNHFHLHEFTYKEFSKLIAQYFRYTKEYFQATYKAVMIGEMRDLTEEKTADLPISIQTDIGVDKFLYFFFICSEKPITGSVTTKVALGEHYSERQVVSDTHAYTTDIVHQQNELKAKDEELKAVHGHTDQLQSEVDRLRLLSQTLEQQLDHIRASKIYKIAHRVSNTIRKSK